MTDRSCHTHVSQAKSILRSDKRRSKGCIYKQVKQPLVFEHAFPPKGFVCMAVHVTFGGGAGIMTTDRPELPYPCFPG